MRLLIDGYNLLHATDLFGAGALAGTLRGSREALVAFLAQRLTEKERRSAVIVFDARDAPPGLPDRYEHDGIDVCFARGYPDADTMIEEILETTKGAKQLTVVSGDRRVQRAARSRGARPIESDAWFAALCQREIEGRYEAKPNESVGSNREWVKEFSDPAALAEIEQQAAAAPPPKPPSPNPPRPATPSKADREAKPPKKRRKPRRGEIPSVEKPRNGGFGAGVFDPFPPGYGEDLLERESEVHDGKSDRTSGPEKPVDRSDRGD